MLGRLAVAPDVQGHGIGTKLLFAVLQYLPETTKEVWVFTGQDSKQNIALYNKAGFEHEFDKQAGDLTYAYLRKVLEAGNSSTTARIPSWSAARTDARLTPSRLAKWATTRKRRRLQTDGRPPGPWSPEMNPGGPQAARPRGRP